MGSIGAAISRQRSQSESKQTYNPDLENTQQGYANALNGPGAAIGSYGMRGGQYPTVGKDPSGFGSGGYGEPGQFANSPNTTNPNNSGVAYPGAADTRSGLTRAGNSGFGTSGRMGSASDAAQAFVNGRNQSYWGPGNTGQPGSGSLYYGQQGGYGDPSQGGSYQFGPGGQSGYGNYSAMQPYQFGSGGAQGDLNATGAAAYGGYGSLAQQYGRLGRQGVTPSERANLFAASNEAIQSNLSGARDQIANRAAQSGNTAGVAGAQARLGATSGQQLEAADRANQTAILQENQRRKEAGLAGQTGAVAGQAGLYGTGTGYAANLLAGRARLASLNQRSYTQGAGTGGTVQGSASIGG